MKNMTREKKLSTQDVEQSLKSGQTFSIVTRQMKKKKR